MQYPGDVRERRDGKGRHSCEKGGDWNLYFHSFRRTLAVAMRLAAGKGELKAFIQLAYKRFKWARGSMKTVDRGVPSWIVMVDEASSRRP